MLLSVAFKLSYAVCLVRLVLITAHQNHHRYPPHNHSHSRHHQLLFSLFMLALFQTWVDEDDDDDADVEDADVRDVEVEDTIVRDAGVETLCVTEVSGQDLDQTMT